MGDRVVAVAAGCPYRLKPDPWSSHSLIVDALSRLPRGARVLDVGSATGDLGRLLGGRGLVLYGLEPNPSWAAAASQYYAQLLNCRLEDAPPEFLAGHDAVICGDILEHLPEPGASLQRLVSLAPAGCRFIVSVPNVANLWMRLNLLLGRFRYQQRGILDQTHLRFFTRDTLIEMLGEAGLEVVRVRATPIPLGLAFPRLARRRLDGPILRLLGPATNLFPTLLGYQFVAEAVRILPVEMLNAPAT